MRIVPDRGLVGFAGFGKPLEIIEGLPEADEHVLIPRAYVETLPIGVHGGFELGSPLCSTHGSESKVSMGLPEVEKRVWIARSIADGAQGEFDREFEFPIAERDARLFAPILAR